MQNDYRGPLEDFAMVVPVPVVLKESDVKIAAQGGVRSRRLARLAAPRRVLGAGSVPAADRPPRRPTVCDGAEAGSRRRASTPQAPSDATAAAARRADERGRAARWRSPPVLASFTVYPPSITAGVATDVTWSFQYANEPWPEPACTVDHGVGRVSDGVPTHASRSTRRTTFTLTCANSAGKSIEAGQDQRRQDRGEVRRRRVPDRDPVGDRGRRASSTWLRAERYKIPAGAEPLLRPYVEAGSKFFVAKVDPKKVKMVDGRAALSPLRFHYDSEEFALPIRLGLANSTGKQDLIVNILAPDQRYEVANYKNVDDPDEPRRQGRRCKTRFGEFYAALFDKTVEENPGAVVTEYAWTASRARSAIRARR